MDRNNINQETLPLFIRDYAEAMIEALQERFSNSDLYNALSIFDVKLFPKTERQMATYGQKEIEFLIVTVSRELLIRKSCLKNGIQLNFI